MSDNVVKLNLVQVGEGYRFEPEHILEQAKVVPFQHMTIIGRTTGGELYVAGTSSAGDTCLLLEQAKHFLVFGKDGLEQ